MGILLEENAFERNAWCLAENYGVLFSVFSVPWSEYGSPSRQKIQQSHPGMLLFEALPMALTGK